MGFGAILLFCHSVFSDGIWKRKGYLCHLFLLFDEFSYLIFTLQFGGGLVAKSCPTLATPWTVARQAPLSMGLSRQEYWRGLPGPPPGDLSDPGIKHASLNVPCIGRWVLYH